MNTMMYGPQIPADDSEGPIGPLVLEEPRLADQQAGTKPVTLAPVPPADANRSELQQVTQQPASTPTATAVPFGVVPWAAAAILTGAALIAWALASRAKALRAAKAVQTANADASTSDPNLAEDMQELTDRLARELDTRAQRLERLIVTADERISRLEALEERLGAHLEQAQRAAKPRVPTTSLAASAAPHAELKPAPVEVPALTGMGGSGDPGIAAVYQLADQGLPAVQIAQRTGRPTGQVELILNLRRAAMG
ncbi:MAG TPA: hypothetical protein VHN77_07980 [Phycisphaerales bacterium]|nr:hypothetical protein [Phycisphaerales bacterium]